jgi:hypothetical protein
LPPAALLWSLNPRNLLCLLDDRRHGLPFMLRSALRLHLRFLRTLLIDTFGDLLEIGPRALEELRTGSLGKEGGNVCRFLIEEAQILQHVGGGFRLMGHGRGRGLIGYLLVWLAVFRRWQPASML